MDTSKNKTQTTGEKRMARNSPALFEFYRSLTALNVVAVGYVQADRHFKRKEADREVEAYGVEQTDVEKRAEEVTEKIQHLVRQLQNGSGCGPGETWDPATKTCG